MAHDVFISYASEDKPVADAVCAKLEARRVRCWIAPRDILAGMDYGEAIERAIHDAPLVVLVFSSHANASDHVKNEVERAVSSGKPILPFRVQETVPSGSLALHLARRHWLDALTPPLERYLEKLCETVGKLLATATPSRDNGGEDLRKPPLPFDVKQAAGKPTVEDSPVNQGPPAAVQPDAFLKTQPGPSSPSVPNWAYVTGVSDLLFWIEPGVASRIRMSPGAAFRVLTMADFDDKRWTKIRLEDGRNGWVEGVAASQLQVSGRTMPFSTKDPRTFFVTRHEVVPRVGFLLANIHVNTATHQGSGGFQDSLYLVDSTWGEVSIRMDQIRRIAIDRRTQGPCVNILTNNQEYRGEFPQVAVNGFGSAYLIVTRPFVSLIDIRNEIDLQTIENAVLETTPAPARGNS